MSVDYENMTMEEYFTHKASSVEDAIVNHCEGVCKLIMAQYEEARSKELGALEQTSSSSKVGMIISLEAISGPHEGRVFPIHPKSNTYPILGRSNRPDVEKDGVSLSRDHEVSSYHGKFFIRGGQLKYKDTHSTNHSFHNGELVEQDVTLKDGSILTVGQTQLRVSIKKMKQ